MNEDNLCVGISTIECQLFHSPVILSLYMLTVISLMKCTVFALLLILSGVHILYTFLFHDMFLNILRAAIKIYMP